VHDVGAARGVEVVVDRDAHPNAVSVDAQKYVSVGRMKDMEVGGGRVGRVGERSDGNRVG
jgi:hypothetical protein